MGEEINMKKIIFYIILWILGTVFLYGIFAFATWEISPGKWPVEARGFWSFILLFMTATSLAAYFDLPSKTLTP